MYNLLDCVKGEQHFHFHGKCTVILATAFGPPAVQIVLLQDLFLCVNQMHVVVSLGNVLHVGSKY